MITPDQQQKIDQLTQQQGLTQPPQQNTAWSSYDSLVGNSSQQGQPHGDGFFAKAGKDIKDAFSSGVNQVKEGFNQADSKSGNPIDLIEGVGKIGSGAINAVTSPLAPVMEPVGKALNAVTAPIQNNPTVQKFANSPAGEATSRVAEDVGNYANIAGTEGGAMEAPHAASVVKDAASDAGTTVADTVSGAKEAVKTNLEGKYVKQAQEQWSKPATTPRAGFKAATKIFDKAADQGHDISETLVKSKINPADNISEGMYQTKETAQALRDDAVKTSNDVLRPSLHKADAAAGTPRTPVQDLMDSAIKNINKNKSITAENKESLITQIARAQKSLETKFPDGMSLENLHDEKIVRDANAKYSPVGDMATNAEAVKNKAIADAARKTLETNAPPEIPVKAFNDELTKQYQAADYLDALDNKKAPVTTGAKIRQGVGKIVGAKVGAVFGGGILGGVAGYHTGGMLESMLENLPNPIKTHFLQNLETSNPEAFAKVQDYLQNAKTIPKGETTNSVAKAADLTRKPLPKTIKVNQYDKPFPKHLTPDQVKNALPQ